MKTWQIEKYGSIDGLMLSERPDPAPGPNEIVVRVRANSLNYRDLMVVTGRYRSSLKAGLVPLSDGAGEVVAAGKRVTRVKTGERVAAIFHQRWIGGRLVPEYTGSDLGGSVDGMLSELVTLSEEGVVRVPAHLSFEEAATLPCAAVTAWAALTGPTPVAPGDTVLTLGSGGVSVFALQFAKLFGARVISTTSSAEKAARLKALGADDVINYRETPEWDKAVSDLTAGRGADYVVEVGGPATLPRSIRAAALGGHITLIGIIAGTGQMLDPLSLRGKGLTLRSITVGSRQTFEAMNRAIELHRLRPVVDRKVAFADARDAYRLMESQKHFGKIVIG
jgi:NADPH:quinone reductase-like Zn-dependent oxidoreductase